MEEEILLSLFTDNMAIYIRYLKNEQKPGTTK